MRHIEDHSSEDASFWEDGWEDDAWDQDEEVWVSDFRTWDDLQEQLSRCSWDEVGGEGIRVFRQLNTLTVLEMPPLRARHRRGLHRAGFRRAPGATMIHWRWTVPAEDEPTDPAARFAYWIHRLLADQRCLAEMAVRVARDVMRLPPEHVVVSLIPARPAPP